MLKFWASLFWALCCFVGGNGISHASEFQTCADSELASELNSTRCATVSVPLDYSAAYASKNPDKQLSLFVRKFPATEKKEGTIWLIAGGPGESGASFYATILVFQEAFPNFDLMVPDHRGTGYSSTICPQESVDSAAGKQLTGAEWGGCISYMYADQSYVKAFSITNAAHDLAHLIEHYSGDGKVYVYGVSYGTQLSLRLLQLKQVELDGVILDSLVPLQDDIQHDLSKRSFVVNRIGLKVLKRCDNNDQCKAEKPLASILETLLETKPLLSDYNEKLPAQKLSMVLGTLLDIPELRGRIAELIKKLSDNETTLLVQTLDDIQTFYSSFNNGYPNYGSSIPLVQVISASENNLRPSLSKEHVAIEEQELLFTSPLAGLLAGNRMPTYERDRYYAKVPDVVPSILVLQGSLDPKTHINGARQHVSALKNSGVTHMVEITDAPHFVALHSPKCFIDLSMDFVKGTEALPATCVDKKVKME